MVNEPVAMFLDEPTTGLDPQARRSMWKLIDGLRSDGMAIMLTTHYMEEAEVLCDRVAVIDRGAIVAVDAPQTLIRQLTGPRRPVGPQGRRPDAGRRLSST